MRRNFDFLTPRIAIRAGLGLLLALNLVAAGFAFHWWNDSPKVLAAKVDETRHELALERAMVVRSKTMATKVDTARDQGGTFVSTYMTPRRTTYSTILGELNEMAAQTGIKTRESSIARDQVEGSESLSVLTITAGYEATYPNLLKFMNLLDKSPRFLIIANLQAAPQASSPALLVTIKLNTFVRDDAEDLL